MADNVTPAARSENMALIRSKHTKPELAVRRILRSIGVGYRLHAPNLPGRPDIVMFGRKAIVDVRGCFWHRHECCRCAYVPKTRSDFWRHKFAATVERDNRNEAALSDAGWRVLVIWECEVGNLDQLKARLTDFLRPKAA